MADSTLLSSPQFEALSGHSRNAVCAMPCQIPPIIMGHEAGTSMAGLSCHPGVAGSTIRRGILKVSRRDLHWRAEE
jgi:hypothetical protein